MKLTTTLALAAALLSLAGCTEEQKASGDAFLAILGTPGVEPPAYPPTLVADPEPYKVAWSGDERDPACYTFRVAYCGPNGERLLH